MRPLVLALLVTCCLSAAERERFEPTPGAVDGIWTGAYWYHAPGHRPVHLTVILQTSDGAIRGRVLEPNTFGDPAAIALGSSVEGRRVDEQVQLRFTYDGDGGVDHSVDNLLAFDQTGLVLTGTWSIGDDWTGGITLTKRSDLHRDEALETVAEHPPLAAPAARPLEGR